MSRRLDSKFLVAFLIVSLAVILQLKIGPISGLYPNFVLAALIALVFFIDFSELGFLAIFSATILNWRPGLSPEILFLVSLPVAVSALIKFLPVQTWLNFTLAFTLGFLVFYSAAGFQGLVKSFNLLFMDFAISAVFAVPTFIIFKNLYASKL